MLYFITQLYREWILYIYSTIQNNIIKEAIVDVHGYTINREDTFIDLTRGAIKYGDYNAYVAYVKPYLKYFPEQYIMELFNGTSNESISHITKNQWIHELFR